MIWYEEAGRLDKYINAFLNTLSYNLFSKSCFEMNGLFGDVRITGDMIVTS